jgi:diguanylate cyclase (GGDEF)-like protein
MSSPLRTPEKPDTPPFPMPVEGLAVTRELPLVSPELSRTLLDDRSKLRVEVLLWQRWVRYLALGTLVLLSLVFGASVVGSALLPLAVLSVAYVGVVMSTSYILLHDPRPRSQAWFPSLLLATDIITLSGFVYLTSPPYQAYRILLFGFLSMQLGVFYFGRRHGWLAAFLTVGAYLLVTVVLVPMVPGQAPTNLGIAFNVTLYGLISTVLIHTFGSFRERMDALRVYCKVVEKGEAAALPQLGAERWPDELTLLARSFQSMHVRLAEQIGSDPLTGCLNRRSLEAKLRADLRSARRRGSTVAVAALDLDHFKAINDAKGHPVGDVVLSQVAGLMKQTARDTDCVARVGGDEFLIVLPDTGWQGALTFAERLRRRVDDFAFGPPGMTLSLTVSIGVALGRGIDPITADMLLNEADTALYKAKTAGRNRVFS